MDDFNFLDFTNSKNNKCKRKIKSEIDDGKVLKNAKSQGQMKITDCFKAEKRRIDRFDGCPEAELYTKCLPDHLAPNLDILIIGINPGLFAAFKGHHYAGPGNHFWKCLYLSGLIPEPLTALDDYKLIQYGIGFTNIVQRTTRGSADLKPQEIKEGAKVLLEKIRRYQPKIAVFNGKEIFRIFSGRKEFDFGRQPTPIDGTQTTIYVMPSSSARCSQLPRASDKVPFYVALKKLRDYLCGRLAHLSDGEVTFSSVLQTAPRKNGQNPTTPKSGNNGIKQVKREYSASDNGFDDDDDKREATGLDDDGRPKILGPNCVYDIRLIKEEITDDNNDDDQLNASLARENSSAVADLTSLLDKSSYYVGLTTPDYSSDINNYNNGLTIFQPNLTTSQYFATPRFYTAITSSVDGDGCNGKDGNGGDEKTDGDETNEGDGEHAQSDGVDHNAQPPYENGSKNESSTTVGGECGSLSAQVPSAAAVASVAGRSSLEQSSNSLQLSQHINGDNSSITIKMEPSSSSSTQQHSSTTHHAAPSHPPSSCNLPPEIALHVEEAIEAVVQRARDGPLEMPAFRTPAEKSAAAHAHQQQQHQQQMFANLQLQAAAAAAAAAHFDLNRGMKGAAETVGLPAAALLGAANYEQSCQASANPSALYSQYFQQPQANQSSFPTAGAAGFGSSAAAAAAVGAGYGSQWTFTTATTSAAAAASNAAVMYNHPSNMMAAAPYFQNAAAAAFPGQQLYHQGSNVNSATGAATFTTTTPYFNQQQAAAQQQSMYGNYAAGFNMQQQSPHNL